MDNLQVRCGLSALAAAWHTEGTPQTATECSTECSRGGKQCWTTDAHAQISCIDGFYLTTYASLANAETSFVNHASTVNTIGAYTGMQCLGNNFPLIHSLSS